MLFSEPKIPQSQPVDDETKRRIRVSVLFSEPKIPQCLSKRGVVAVSSGFSALQRAENSSMTTASARATESQCFSALQRAENSSILGGQALVVCPSGFSALQRAENSSIVLNADVRITLREFQCSSASRKFLNRGGSEEGEGGRKFQCSSASRKFLNSNSAL